VNLTLLWIPATLLAALAQTARNAMQRTLTATLGTVGASQVRFLFGFPFALLFLLGMVLVTGWRVPAPTATYLAFVLAGAVAQILATVLMLAAMKERSFAVTTAYIKTEPVQVAVFGVVVLHDHLSALSALAIVVATAGVLLMAIKPGMARVSAAGLRPAAYGIVAGAFFALSAIGFRGAILSLEGVSFALASTTTLCWSLGVQTLLLGIWLGLFNREALTRSIAAWRPSLFAGFMGAFASQFWFLGFSLTTAANVRTLALVEVLFAQVVSRRLLDQSTSAREWLGMALIIGGVALLMIAQ
jgi:drug/metabolite transporter (DMT)-like permease